ASALRTSKKEQNYRRDKKQGGD
ncbi:hypothetical protein CCACVL1_00154, partial [Corchorus capsularis]